MNNPIRAHYSAQILHEEHRYKQCEALRVWIATWNVADKEPPNATKDIEAELLPVLGWNKNPADWAHVVVLGLQEVETQKLIIRTGRGNFHRWAHVLEDLVATEGWALLTHRQVLEAGLGMFVLVRQTHYGAIRHLRWSERMFTDNDGFRGKGALAIRMSIQGRSYCFATAHLSAHDEYLHHRHANVVQALRELQFSIPADADDELDHCLSVLPDGDFHGFRSISPDHSRTVTVEDADYAFFFGDLNYRVWLLERDTVLNYVTSGDFDSLLQYDQLHQARRLGQVFDGWEEQRITFGPTFKYADHSLHYEEKKRRTPSWTDRVLYRTRPDDGDSDATTQGSLPPRVGVMTGSAWSLGGHRNALVPLWYHRVEVTRSDHRPVVAAFDTKVIQIDVAALSAVLERCHAELRSVPNDPWQTPCTQERISLRVVNVEWLARPPPHHLYTLFADLEAKVGDVTLQRQRQRRIPSSPNHFLVPAGCAGTIKARIRVSAWTEVDVVQPKGQFCGDTGWVRIEGSGALTVPSVDGIVGKDAKPRPFVLVLEVALPGVHLAPSYGRLGPFGIVPHLDFHGKIRVDHRGLTYSLHEPRSLGIPADGVITGKLSAISDVTLGPEFRKRAAIPEAAAYYAFAYPVGGGQLDPDLLDLEQPLSTFVAIGGYVYLDENQRILQVNGIHPDGAGLFFEGPHTFTPTAELRERLQPITWSAAREATHASYFVWVTPGENDAVCHGMAPHGAFAYILEDSAAKMFGMDSMFFAVVGEKTKALYHHTVFHTTDAPELLVDDEHQHPAAASNNTKCCIIC